MEVGLHFYHSVEGIDQIDVSISEIFMVILPLIPCILSSSNFMVINMPKYTARGMDLQHAIQLRSFCEKKLVTLCVISVVTL